LVRAVAGSETHGVLDPWMDLFHGSTCACCGLPGRVLCGDCARLLPERGRPVRPTPCPPGLAASFAGGPYDGLLGALVVAHKERGAFALARPLGQVLAVAATGVLDRGATTVLVPVPSRPAVVRARGHDPMLRITRSAQHRLQAQEDLGTVVIGRLLEQRIAVPDQAGLDSRQRAANLVGSMVVRTGARRRLAAMGVPVSIVVCDDVLTTGATAREAQRAVEDAGLRVRAIVTVAATRKRVPLRG
jgi:predicted amidophosphoribosyltransferase